MHLNIASPAIHISRGDSRRTGRYLVDTILFAQMINKSMEGRNSLGASLATFSIFFCGVIIDVTPRWGSDLLELLWNEFNKMDGIYFNGIRSTIKIAIYF